MVLYLDGASVSGTGFVSVVGTQFCGQLQQNLFSKNELSAVDFVSVLTQTSSILTAATVFYNSAGKQVLRTINGVLVTLGTNQVILNETTTGAVSGYNSLTGRRFVYDANGVLL